MTVREAMNIINGALDSLYEFYDNDADSMLEEIGAAEVVLEKLVKKEEKKPEKYFAVCPHCNEELNYDSFHYEDCEAEKVRFFADGTCPHCQRTFNWCETFELVNIDFDEE
jgi:uncharacterized protein with PIN domain